MSSEDAGVVGSAAAEEERRSQPRRGVPLAQFVEDVSEFVKGKEVESVLRGLEERLQQYKMVELKLLAQQKDLQGKIPEIRRSLQVVKKLKQQQQTPGAEDIVSDFEISEGIFTSAVLQPPQSVCLWLGANVMLEYTLDEALSLLESNLLNADGSLKVLQGDVDFLRDQINTTEVTIARVHNWDVKRRRMANPGQ